MRMHHRGEDAIARSSPSAQAVCVSMRHKDERAMTIDGRIRWVFFDVGDTLLDENDMLADWSAKMAALLRRRGIEKSWQDVMAAREQSYAKMSPIALRAMGELLRVPEDVWSACW